MQLLYINADFDWNGLENTGFYPVDLNFIRSEMVLFNCE